MTTTATNTGAAYMEPAKAFVAAAAPALERIAPGIHAEPRILGSIFRINRDTRFSPDKHPYKDHLDLWFWEGDRKSAESGFFLRISPAFVRIGAGAHSFGKDAPRPVPRRSRWTRQRRSARHDRRRARARRLRDRRGALVRTPRGMDADGPAARFLRHGALFVHHEGPAALASDSERLLPTCASVWERLGPLHRWLVNHVQGAAAQSG